MNEYVLKPKNFDLELTLTCGQTFCWHRISGELYGEGGSSFYTFRNGNPIIVEEDGDKINVSTELSSQEVEQALGIDHDLEDVFSEFPEDEKIQVAKDEFWGLRVLNDEFFPCLISYLLSPQMQIPRIKQMFNQIAGNWGETVEFEGRELLRFPTQEELEDVSEEELRELGVGYRAKYVVETLDILDESFHPEKLQELDYLQAREKMKELYGVGDKVADCVLLFSLGFREACPLDTWAWKAMEQHYPRLHSDDYDKASENIRDHFGRNAGYAQEYIFHAARNDVLEVE